MIIDTHVHGGKLKHWNLDIVSTWFPEEADVTSLEVDHEYVIGRMDAGGIDKAFLLAFDAKRLWNSKVPNEHIAEIVNEHADRFIGFASVDPLGGLAAIRELQRAAEDLGLRGLKISPHYQEYMPNDDRAHPIYELAQEYGMPVLIHQATSYIKRSPMRYALPHLLDDVAIAFPELRMILAHIGIPWVEEALYLAVKHEHVYVDVSARGMPSYGGGLKQLFRELATARNLKILDRVFFGSDYPWLDPADYANQVRNINIHAKEVGEEPLSSQELEGIMGGNAVQMLQGLGIELATRAGR